MSRFLDLAGLIALWNKIKTLFYTKTLINGLILSVLIPIIDLTESDLTGSD